ncbi:MAG: DASS family sodium-coupled anion symporter [Acidobacteria bacterium]|nr:DASS family sodium-coupled anion symporter [Acidobacteriota bacterium]MCW5947868.1 DASS family sodium-coupled anion symporter [Pyrinomonadaceae bacterium]
MQSKWVKWLICVGVGVVISLVPPPGGVTREAWTLLSIFIATIVGSMVQPLTGSAMVLLGVTATVVFGALKPFDALKGYADPVVWIVLSAFFLSAAVVKTGLGRRVALIFIKLIGKSTFGLGYALVGTDLVLASVVPSNGARNGGIMIPLAVAVSESFDSRPDDGTANRLGSYLVNLLYQCEVVIGATFLTGHAGNFVMAKLAKETAGIEIGYVSWLTAAIVPSLISLAVIPAIVYRMDPPEIRSTPGAAEFAAAELRKMGKMSGSEKVVVGTLLSVIFLWATKDVVHSVDISFVALAGIAALLVTRVLEWKDLMSDPNAWSTFIWYGGLVNMASALGESGLTKLFAERSAGFTEGFTWMAALAVLLLIYFYSHYFFASITAHVLAMYVPFLAVTLAAGAPAGLAVLCLNYFSTLNASLTHYGTTPGPIYFGLGYAKQGVWWRIGLAASFVNIAVWSTAGVAWWRVIGWW